MEYLRIAPDIDTDPGLELAGWGATRVYELLLKVSALKDLHGRIPLEYQEPAWLAKRWNLGNELGIDACEFISKGIEKLLALPKRLAKLERNGDYLVILGWDNFYKSAKSPAERTAEWRDKKRGVTPRDACDDETSQPSQTVSPVTRVTPVTEARHCDATPLHTTPRHITEEDRRSPSAPTQLSLTPVDAAPSKPKPPPNPRHAQTVDLFSRLFSELHGGTYRVAGAKDGKAVKTLLSWPEATDSEIERRIRFAFTQRFFREQNPSLGYFVSNWNAWQPPSSAPANESTPGFDPDVDADPYPDIEPMGAAING